MGRFRVFYFEKRDMKSYKISYMTNWSSLTKESLVVGGTIHVVPRGNARKDMTFPITNILLEYPGMDAKLYKMCFEPLDLDGLKINRQGPYGVYPEMRVYE